VQNLGSKILFVVETKEPRVRESIFLTPDFLFYYYG
jgi:hypothetical protein